MVAAIVVRPPFCSSPVALPVLFRLWRGKGTASQVDLAAEMLGKLAGAFPGRTLHGVGDAAFHGESLIVEGTTWTARLPANAVLYGPKPPRTGKRGRPRVKGARLGTCAQIAQAADWQDAVIHGWDAIVIGEYERALYGGQYATMAPLFEHYGIQLWIPEVGGRIDFGAEEYPPAPASTKGGQISRKSTRDSRGRARVTSQHARNQPIMGKLCVRT